MTPYTLPVQRTETGVLDLIKRAQTIQRPLLLTVDGSPEPVVVVLNYIWMSCDLYATNRFHRNFDPDSLH